MTRDRRCRKRPISASSDLSSAPMAAKASAQLNRDILVRRRVPTHRLGQAARSSRVVVRPALELGDRVLGEEVGRAALL